MVVYLIGLTGGIASGKSTVARRLVEHGAVHIDADDLARRVVEPGKPAYDAIVEEFGTEVLRHDRTIDRAKLGELVFSDDAARARLNAIVHPLVGERSARLMEEAEASGSKVVVYDVPLLVENDLGSLYDVVVVVDTPDEIRVERVATGRGMPRDQVWARIRAQADRKTRLAAADLVIDNSGTFEELRKRVAEVWRELLARA